MSQKPSLSAVISSLNGKLASSRSALKNATSEEEKKNFEFRVEGLTKLTAKLEQDEQKLADRHQKTIDRFLKKCDAANEKISTRRTGQKRGASCSKDSNQPKTKHTKTAPEDTEKKVAGCFSALPPHLRHEIVKKCDFLDAVHFAKCSRSAYEMSKNIKKMTLEVIHVEFEADMWKLTKRRLENAILATTQEIRSLIIVTKKLVIKSPITEDICLFLMSQVKTMKLECENGFDCPPEHFGNLIRTLQLESLFLNLTNYQRDLPLDVGRIDNVYICDTRWLSSNAMGNLRPRKFLNIVHPTNGQISELIEGNCQSHGCTTWIVQRRLSLSEFSDVMQIFGDRAKFIESAKCWSLTDGKSNNPVRWIQFSPLMIKLLDREDFDRFCNSDEVE